MSARLDLQRHVRELKADALEACDRLAELFPHGRVLECLLVGAFRNSERQGGNPDAPRVERLQEIDEAEPGLSQEILLGYDRVLEHQLAGVARPPPHLVLLLACAYTPGFRKVVRMSDAELTTMLQVHRVLSDDETRDALVSP